MVTSTAPIDRRGAGRPRRAAASAVQHPSCLRSALALISRCCCCSLLLLFAGVAAASAAKVRLDFEGVGNYKNIGDYYGGGAGGPLKDYGVVFGGGEVYGAVDSDDGGTFEIAREPSGTEVAFVAADQQASAVTVSGGFTALSFQYASDNGADVGSASGVSVYAGPNLTGEVLGAANLPFTGFCGFDGVPECGDPTGMFGVWVNVTVPFTGVARSAGFTSIFYLDDLVLTLPSTCTKARGACGGGGGGPPPKNKCCAGLVCRKSRPNSGPPRCLACARSGQYCAKNADCCSKKCPKRTGRCAAA